MGLLYVKALHLIFVVSWFAGLFYIVRLFIYHTESQTKPAGEQKVLHNQFRIMEYRLWNIITWPAAVLATFFGLWLLIELKLWTSPWMMVKLGLTTLLWVYQIITHIHYKRFQKGVYSWTSKQYRLWNEVATLWLVSIVFVVTLKSTMNWIGGTIGFFAVGVLLMLGIRLYRRLQR